MQSLDNNTQAFFALVRAGLWEQEGRLSQFGTIDYLRVLSLAEEQSVVGLVAAGLEHIIDAKVKKETALQFVGKALQLEKQNKAMNSFIIELIETLRNEDIYALLLKGQGIAQCYERPFWRSCGDIDLFLSKDNYKKAKGILIPKATSIQEEWERTLHLGMTIDSWVVELHGSLCGSLSPMVNRELNCIRRATFYGGNVRSWNNDGTTVFLLDINNDIIYVFTHILNHFYKGGIGLRQICDWSRLLWVHQKVINVSLLKLRIQKMGVMTEWKAFGSFAVEYLGMPEEAMPFYSSAENWKRKASRICSFIMEVGNFGHNRDMSYFKTKNYLFRKFKSFGRRCGDLLRHALIFPLDTMIFSPYIIYNGVKDAIRGD